VHAAGGEALVILTEPVCSIGLIAFAAAASFALLGTRLYKRRLFGRLRPM
jgi:hypothetical protein